MDATAVFQTTKGTYVLAVSAGYTYNVSMYIVILCIFAV